MEWQLSVPAQKRGPFTLQALSLRLTPGARIALTGSNGSGKSTLLQAVYNSASTQGLRVSLLPDSAPQEAHLTVRELLTEIALLHGLAAAATRVAELLAQWSLLDVAERPCARLSLGYRQRVALALALLPQPQLLLLDEPANGLDPAQQQFLQQLLARDAELALIMVTHQVQDWQQTLTERWVMQNGALIHQGSHADFAQAVNA